MDTAAIKRFAVAARAKLLKQVEQKAFELGITAKKIKEFPVVGDQVNIHGQLVDKAKRDRLIAEVENKGFAQVMEKMAYTWFNRFAALRFMEINGYLPSGVRILSSQDKNRVEPDIFREIMSVHKALAVELEQVFEMQDKGDSEALFKYLIIAQCNALHKTLPFMFEPLDDYSELLFPDNLLVEDSVIQEMITTIDEDEWKEVEIIGWLYQFYVSGKKDEVFAGLTGRNKISKENIPAATQLFTPKWIVQYMVENSLGRLWLESQPESNAASNWRYYLEPVEQESEVQKQLDSLRKPNLKPEDITLMDPACGSGHILVYAFDVLYLIYQERGFLAVDIPELILKHNLFGLEIDDRAAQLASFALMMKARSKDPEILQKGILPNIISIQESDGLKGSFLYTQLAKEAQEIVDELISVYKDGKNLGSILNPKINKLELLSEQINSLASSNLKLGDYEQENLILLKTLIKQTELLNKKYDVVVTNPPYMGSRNMNAGLTNYLRRNYPDSKWDLFAVFLERSVELTRMGGAAATINQHSWMFLSSYEKLRVKLLKNQTVQSLLHLGPRTFDEISGEVVQSVAFVLRNMQCRECRGEYHRLTEGANSEEKRLQFLSGRKRSIQKAKNFHSIPGSPIAYWASARIYNVFLKGKSLRKFALPRHGMSTGRNAVFLRAWWETRKDNITLDALDVETFDASNKRWAPYNKGGVFRKWYGNQEHVISYDAISRDKMKSFPGHRHDNRKHYFKEGITWSFVSSSRFGVRYTPPGCIFDVGGSSLFPKKNNLFYILGFMCSKLGHEFLKYLNPTLNFQVGNIASLPIRVDEKKVQSVEGLVEHNIELSKTDWDSFETSWDFRKHPLLLHKDGSSLENAFKRWEKFAERQFQQLKANEEELNRIFIAIYGLEDELTPDVADEDVTIRRAERERDIKSFISYAVGCMFGRYSLDEDGLAFAGEEFDHNKYKTFRVSESNILPILDARYFEDDIVSRFVEFVKVVFGEESLEENLEYIADSIGRKRTDSAREGIRRYFLRDFYKDHVRIYQKRPIYWLFQSPSGTFNALIYLHRCNRDTVGRIRTDYLLEFQERLAVEESSLRQRLNTELTRREETKIRKRLAEIDKQMKELQEYHEEIHELANKRIDLDLDDGVAVNYDKFGSTVAKL